MRSSPAKSIRLNATWSQGMASRHSEKYLPSSLNGQAEEQLVRCAKLSARLRRFGAQMKSRPEFLISSAEI